MQHAETRGRPEVRPFAEVFDDEAMPLERAADGTPGVGTRQTSGLTHRIWKKLTKMAPAAGTVSLVPGIPESAHRARHCRKGHASHSLRAICRNGIPHSDAQHVHAHLQRVTPAAQNHAADRADIGIVAAPRKGHVRHRRKHVVGRIDVHPTEPRTVDRQPGV